MEKAGGRFLHEPVEHPGLLVLQGTELPQPAQSGARVFGTVLVQGRDGREPERLAVVGREDEGLLDQPGRFAFEPVAVRACERLGLGEKLGHRECERVRSLPGVPGRGLIEPARLAKQNVDPGREQRNRDPEGDGGAPAGECAVRTGGVAGGAGGGTVFRIEVPKQRTRNIVARLAARRRILGGAFVAGIDLREAGPVSGERRGAAVEARGGSGSQERPGKETDTDGGESGGEDPEEGGQSAGSAPSPALTTRSSRSRSSSVRFSRAGARLRTRTKSQPRAAAASTNGPHHRRAVAASNGGR